MSKNTLFNFFFNPFKKGDIHLKQVFQFNLQLRDTTKRDSSPELPESTTATTFFEKLLEGTERRGTYDQKKSTASNSILKSSTNLSVDKPI